MQLTNYLPDQNKFKLAGPPAFFLKQLWDFDDSLVVVPSRQGFYYRLAQRRRPNLSMAVVNEALWKESDTQMLASYNLVPVTTIIPTANWSNPFLFEELRRRSPHRMGGAEKVIQQLEAMEAEKETKLNAQIDDNNSILAKDAWRLYNKKIGVRSHMYSPTVKHPDSAAAPAFRMKSSSSHGSGVQVGSIFLP
jgi:hypothetical protein